MIKSNISLKDFTTFKIGGMAKYFSIVKTKDQLLNAFLFSKKKNIPFFILGNGSNVLFDDRGFSGIVIKNEMKGFKIDGNLIFAYSGTPLQEIAKISVLRKKSGLEFAFGIPATIGGAVYMNAGAYKKNIADIIKSVEFISYEGEDRIFKKEEIEFFYRYSSFQKKRGMITEICLNLKEGVACETLKENIEKREKTQPKGKNAGCIFSNTCGISSGFLIEECGLKGKVVGGAMISDIHGNFIINKKEASSKDILKLIKLIQDKIKKRYNIELKKEICYVPYEG